MGDDITQSMVRPLDLYFFFHGFDVGHDGELDYTEFTEKLKNMNEVMQEIDTVWTTLDEDGGGAVDNMEFYLQISEILPDAGENLGEDIFLKAFNDLDRDGDDLVSESEFKQVLMGILEDN